MEQVFFLGVHALHYDMITLKLQVSDQEITIHTSLAYIFFRFAKELDSHNEAFCEQSDHVPTISSTAKYNYNTWRKSNEKADIY